MIPIEHLTAVAEKRLEKLKRVDPVKYFRERVSAILEEKDIDPSLVQYIEINLPRYGEGYDVTPLENKVAEIIEHIEKVGTISLFDIIRNLDFTKV